LQIYIFKKNILVLEFVRQIKLCNAGAHLNCVFVLEGLSIRSALADRSRRGELRLEICATKAVLRLRAECALKVILLSRAHAIPRCQPCVNFVYKL
jgi:hypothetical protein